MPIFHTEFEQYSDEYWAVRNGLPTASSASKLITSAGKTSTQYKELALTLAADMYAGKAVDSWEGNGATQRGTELEPEAREAYEFIKGVDVEQVGFVTDNNGIYGASPDGTVGQDGLVEIKCQMAKGHVKTLDYFAKNGKAPPDYISQCQMQMFVTGRGYCDLFHYHPSLPPIIIRQIADKEFFAVLESQIKEVIKERERLIKVLEAA